MNIQPIEWLENRVRILDQTRLPHEEAYLETADYNDVASAIVALKIRGAPAIGIAAAYGVALGALEIRAGSRDEFRKKLRAVSRALAATRPTARNLFRALHRMERIAAAGEDIEETKRALVAEAIKIHSEEIEASRKLSLFGARLIAGGSTVLTHCNTGPLATTGHGSALGVVIQATEQGKKIAVYATETRPLLQGARLTTWELKQAGVPFTLITDSMAGHFIGRGKIDCVIVGADRIAANGDTANKIGTYTLAVLAAENGIPFYVAAPTTTIDPSLFSGGEIPIEERNPAEITSIGGVSIAPEETAVANPAFDITPQRYIGAIITEKGIIRKPYYEGIKTITG